MIVLAGARRRSPMVWLVAVAAWLLPGCGYVWDTSAPSSPPPPSVVEFAVEDEEVPEPSETSLPFRVPDGYVAERVAGPPLVTHPMFACFDDRGRLYVAGSSGGQVDRDSRLANPPDVI